MKVGSLREAVNSQAIRRGPNIVSALSVPTPSGNSKQGKEAVHSHTLDLQQSAHYVTSASSAERSADEEYCRACRSTVIKARARCFSQPENPKGGFQLRLRVKLVAQYMYAKARIDCSSDACHALCQSHHVLHLAQCGKCSLLVSPGCFGISRFRPETGSLAASVIKSYRIYPR